VSVINIARDCCEADKYDLHRNAILLFLTYSLYSWILVETTGYSRNSEAL